MKVEVKEVKPVVEPPKEYILTLDQNEMDLLVCVFGRIGGYDGPGGWREIINKIYDSVLLFGKVDAVHSMLDECGYIKGHPPVKPK